MSKLIFKQALVIFVMSTVYVIISVLSPSILTGKQGVLYYLIKDYTNKEVIKFYFNLHSVI